MPHYRYLIIGAGMAGDAAVRGIREVDASGTIGVLGAEPHPPYNRPPLSKGLWKGQPEEQIWRDTAALGAELHLGRRAVRIDKAGHLVVDDRGATYTYEKLLLATGGQPRRLPLDPAGEHVIYFRTYDDYRRLRERATPGTRFAVVGGGFIGSEIAAALALQGVQVIMLFPEEGIGARLFPPGLSRFLNDYYRERGVEVRAGELAAGLEARGGRLALRTDRGQEVEVDGVVAGIGIQPNDQLAAAATLRTDDGIVVDDYLRTSDPDIYAAGDVARFFAPALGSRIRVEHEDNANTMGQAAGRNMAGRAEPYHHLPFFYSDLFDLGYEAVGDVDARLQVVEDWREPYREGVVYYLREGRVRGVLLWNVWEQVEHARALIATAGPHHPESLRGRLPV
ncbi:MAG: FAD-dependent oxidoreductase [Armatimonadota bacterium]|nr:FAD-dependent oxidoreductase [Armatimonadota bacterium]MDR7437248.1 FAD-dependent oxidoreductase [Armatimonadota bacterium]MDR7471469.1 FAD-dependent oxidoreductase [Armatimonadota bacterium]MDR7506580.1 FAD-dependent oxidoreductase [Armatimonadota bacterium]MDR7509902.1 FAD-dependent oxidoreductase [Armatimonadota bacterium]